MKTLKSETTIRRGASTPHLVTPQPHHSTHPMHNIRSKQNSSLKQDNHPHNGAEKPTDSSPHQHELEHDPRDPAGHFSKEFENQESFKKDVNKEKLKLNISKEKKIDEILSFDEFAEFLSKISPVMALSKIATSAAKLGDTYVELLKSKFKSKPKKDESDESDESKEAETAESTAESSAESTAETPAEPASETAAESEPASKEQKGGNSIYFTSEECNFFV